MKAKQILAILAIVLLLGLYAASLIFALIGSEWTQPFLLASVYLTILVPIVLYGFLLALKKRDERRKQEEDPSEK